MGDSARWSQEQSAWSDRPRTLAFPLDPKLCDTTLEEIRRLQCMEFAVSMDTAIDRKPKGCHNLILLLCVPLSKHCPDRYLSRSEVIRIPIACALLNSQV